MNPDIDRPNVAFQFPYRWLTDDKDFLGENLCLSVKRYMGESEGQLSAVLAYRIVIFYYAEQPLPINLTTKQIQAMLKRVFPNAKCLSVDDEYNKLRAKKTLPVMDFRIYF